MTPTTTLPPFTGETFDDLLADVEQRIREEPARLDMRTWVSAIDGVIHQDLVIPRAMPACGTVCCVGGWMALRSGRINTFDDSDDCDDWRNLYRALTAERITVGDIAGDDWHGLFDQAVFDDASRELKIADPCYVPTVLNRLAAFRLKHADSLKTPLPPRGAQTA